ncbi:MAG: apolipoprotein N-acyltransferase [Sandaracinus sp.]
MRRALGIGALAGLCIGLAGMPEQAFWLAWLGPGLLLVGLEPTSGALVRPRVAIVLGLACGLSCNAWTMRWAIELFERYAYLPWPAALGLSILLWLGQSAPWAFGLGLAAALRPRRAWAVLPIALTVSASLVPMIFPWRPGVSQTGWLPFVQCAELGGPPLVDLLFLGGAIAAMQALRRRDRSAALVAALCLLLPLAWGTARLATLREERAHWPLLRVGLLQHGLGIEERIDGSRTLSDHQAMRRSTAALEREGAELVVWPESAYGFGWQRDWVDDPVGEDGFFHDGVHGPLLVGAITSTWSRLWNSVLAIEDGRVTGIADKVHLMAFTEEVPLWDELPPLQQLVSRGLMRGTVESEVLRVGGVHVGILNCFEDLVPEHARALTGLGAELLSNHTNDAWFGDTTAPHMHRFLSTMRAIETRRDLVRVVGTGPSGLTSALGERDEGTPTFVAATRIVEARLGTEITPWVRYGDLVTTPLAVALVLLALHAARRARWQSA